MKTLLFGSKLRTLLTLLGLAWLAFVISYAVNDNLPGDISTKVFFFFFVLASLTGFLANLSQILQWLFPPKLEPAPVPNIELKPQFTFQISPPEIAAPTPASPTLDKPAPIAPAPRTILPDGKRITGSIRPELLDIPMSGREQDVVEVLERLQKYPTTIEGIGGLGKSRLAVAVIMNDAISSAVWLVANESTRSDDVLSLLRDHFELAVDASNYEVTKKLREQPTLIVIDNAESIPETTHLEIINLINELRSSAKILLTSRVAWNELRPSRSWTPTALDRETAARVVMDMAEVFGVQENLTSKAEELAQAARLHPRLIELGIIQITRGSSPEAVIRELKALRSDDTQKALDEMLLVNIRQMVERDDPDGEMILKKLNIFRGGFTENAAKTILDIDNETFDRHIRVLVLWQFIKRQINLPTLTRYYVEPLLQDIVHENPSLYPNHFDYFQAFAIDCNEKQDLSPLDEEVANYEVAFIRAKRVGHTEAAFSLTNSFAEFLVNRGRYKQLLQWLQGIEDSSATLNNYTKIAFYNALGVAYLQYSKTESTIEHLQLAIGAFQKGYKFSNHNSDFSITINRNNLGIALVELGRHNSQPYKILRAIAVHKKILETCNPIDDSFTYGTTQNLLGNAYLALKNLTGNARCLKEAENAYQEALKSFSPQKWPLDFAGANISIGNIYLEFSNQDLSSKSLKAAIHHYKVALPYLTQKTAPMDYGTLQNNLGVAHRLLAEHEDKVENLRLAIGFYDVALKYRPKEITPYEYALTARGLGMSHLKLNDPEAAIRYWQEAEPVFRELGIIEDADKVLSWINEALER